MPLTDTQLRQLKPKDRPYKVADGGGLLIHVTPNGSKLRRLKRQKSVQAVIAGRRPAIDWRACVRHWSGDNGERSRTSAWKP